MKIFFGGVKKLYSFKIHRHVKLGHGGERRRRRTAVARAARQCSSVARAKTARAARTRRCGAARAAEEAQAAARRARARERRAG